MPPFRNPFSSRKPPTNGLESINDENARPLSNGATEQAPKPSLALGTKSDKEQPDEFKLSAVNDSGVYLPPSPTEKKSFWHKSPHSTQSSSHRSVLNENEAFTISRESFESYRRSFDISGRSPVLGADSFPSRTSLDSRAAPRLPRSAVNGNTFQRPTTTEEEGFEDVGLNDEVKPKKRGFLSRFGDSGTDASGSSLDPVAPTHHGFHLPGRKRGQSGKGAELGNIERPDSKGKGDGVIR